MNNKDRGFLLPLLAGVFSQTQVRIVGNIGVAEVFFFVLAPFLFLCDYKKLKRNGFIPFLYLCLATILGAFISGRLNSTGMAYTIRGAAMVYAIFAGVVCFHHMFYRNVGLFKWTVLGFAISMTLNVFVLQYGAEADSLANGTTAQGVMQGTLFWVSRGTAWMRVLLWGWYLSTPVWVLIVLQTGLAVFSVAATASGRSAALGVLAGVLMVVFAGHSTTKMCKISKNFFLVVFAGVCLMWGAKTVYVVMGRAQMLNAKQNEKFLSQTEGGTKTSILALLMHGRSEFFAGAYAALQHPIIGYGPWARDREGVYAGFLIKYGDAEAYQAYVGEVRRNTELGLIPGIPSHSQVIEFWHWYGLPGLIFQLYVLFLYIQYYRKYVSAVPQFFGILGVGIAGMIWHYFFSPFGSRQIYACMWTILLFNRAIAKGVMRLPNYMLREKIIKCR